MRLRYSTHGKVKNSFKSLSENLNIAKYMPSWEHHRPLTKNLREIRYGDKKALDLSKPK
jgi:hypothetical protein